MTMTGLDGSKQAQGKTFWSCRALVAIRRPVIANPAGKLYFVPAGVGKV
ncbi:hypothetical protein [Rhizobium sp. AN80A]|nr:hypothetical protein [Rhizobium sp. AN80A]